MLKFSNFSYKNSPKSTHKGVDVKIKFHITKDDMRSVIVEMIKANIHHCHDDPTEQFANLQVIRNKFSKRSIEAELRSLLHSSGKTRLEFGGWDQQNSEQEDKLGEDFIDHVLNEVFGL